MHFHPFHIALLLVLGFSELTLSSELQYLTQHELDFLANIDYELLPQVFKDYIEYREKIVEEYSKNTNSSQYGHICCLKYGSNPFDIVQITTTNVNVIVTTFVAVIREKCGNVLSSLWNPNEYCTKYVTGYRQSVEYYQGQAYLTPPKECPDAYITCCKDYIMIAKNCLPLDWVSQNQAIVLALLTAPPAFGK